VSELTASGLGVQVESDGGKTLIPAPPVVEQEKETPTGRDENGVPSIVGLGDGTVLPNGEFIPTQPLSIPAAPSYSEQDKISVAPSSINGTGATVTIVDHPPAPQLAPVKAPKQKRYTGPKEFSVALKAAENRLAKAIVERAQAAGSLAALNAEIPSLLGIINALKGSGNYVSPVPTPNFVANDFPGNYFPNALSGGPNPAQQFQPALDPMDAIRAAMAAPPVSRAIGNAVQLPPDVVGTLEGPDDDNDDPDKFLTGPYAGGGFIGG
jgi:hypothetical protein